MQVRAAVLRVAVLVLVAVLFTTLVLGQPTGATNINRGDDERGDENTNGAQVQAQAGNVTALTINASTLSTYWQGYYGNISGQITLDDASNNSLYQWDLVSPEGQIYAVNDSAVPTWSDVYCFNFSNNKSNGEPIVQRFNGTDIEPAFGMLADDVDGFDETFNRTFSGSFSVGATTIDVDDGCSLVALNVDDQYQEASFEEVLLTDNNSIIFTALLEQDATGFQGSELDFQMLVADDGSTVDPTAYYFYVELS